LLLTEDSSEVVEEALEVVVEEAVVAFVADLLVKGVKKAMKSIDNRVSKKEVENDLVKEEWEAVADGDLSIDAIIVANVDHLVIDRREVMDKK
jgi:hypothetical protein